MCSVCVNARALCVRCVCVDTYKHACAKYVCLPTKPCVCIAVCIFIAECIRKNLDKNVNKKQTSNIPNRLVVCDFVSAHACDV